MTAEAMQVERLVNELSVLGPEHVAEIDRRLRVLSGLKAMALPAAIVGGHMPASMFLANEVAAEVSPEKRAVDALEAKRQKASAYARAYHAKKKAAKLQEKQAAGADGSSPGPGRKRRVRESVKPAGVEPISDDINGNLFTPEERRVAMVKLIAERGAMSPGAIAASLNMDVAKVYNVMAIEPGRSLFETTPNGKGLTSQGWALHRELKEKGAA